MMADARSAHAPADARRVEDAPGFVLHTHPYRETSVIVEAWTEHHGRVALVARGARRARSELRGTLVQLRTDIERALPNTSDRASRLHLEGAIHRIGEILDPKGA